MSDDATFTFNITKYFFPMMNKGYDLTNLDGGTHDYREGEGDFSIILCSSIPNNVYDCIDDTGCLDRTVEDFVEFEFVDESTNEETGYVQPYFNLKVNPINDYLSGFTIGLDTGTTDLQINVGDEYQNLKAMFLVRRSNLFVMGYAVINQPIQVKNLITLPFDSKLVGVGYCQTYL